MMTILGLCNMGKRVTTHEVISKMLLLLGDGLDIDKPNLTQKEVVSLCRRLVVEMVLLGKEG